MIWVVLSVSFVLSLSVAVLARDLRRLEKSLNIAARSVHVNSTQTKHYVGDSFAARVLRSAAEDLDSVEGQTELHRIGNTVYKIGGPSIGNLWLHERADNILPEPEMATEFNLDGSPA